MTPYRLEPILEPLVESVLCLLVLLGVYRWLLENQPMHQLKRLYLLGTLLVSLVVPVTSIKVPSGWTFSSISLQIIDGQLTDAKWRGDEKGGSQMAMKGNVPAIGKPAPRTPAPYWLWIYSAITTLMLARFVRNLYVLAHQIRVNPTEPFYGATLVKLSGNGLPYTFLHYLFVSAEDYDRGKVEDELVAHEMTHIRQRHSLDVLLIEIVLCFGWFNPLLFWLKRAMQRNHEFLADEAVNETYRNVPGYQQLLLSKVAIAPPPLSLTSSLTFQTTKQRLLMMTKHNSPARTWLAGCSTALLFTSLTLLLSGTAPAQPPIFPLKSETTPRPSRPLLTVTELESRFGDVVVNATSRELSAGQKIMFKDLTPEQKARVIYLEGRLPSTFTEEEFNALKNAKRYSIWVDGKRARHFDRTTLTASDIITYNIRRLDRDDRRPDRYFYQVDLLTDSAAVAHAKELQARPTLLLLTDEQMQKRRTNTAR